MRGNVTVARFTEGAGPLWFVNSPRVGHTLLCRKFHGGSPPNWTLRSRLWFLNSAGVPEGTVFRKSARSLGARPRRVLLTVLPRPGAGLGLQLESRKRVHSCAHTVAWATVAGEAALPLQAKAERCFLNSNGVVRGCCGPGEGRGSHGPDLKP